MADAETPAPKKTIDPAVIIVAYVCGAIGLIFILGISFCVLRRIRWRRARKYIKQQSKRAQAMGPTLTSQPPKTPFTLKSVKAGIKARDEERKVELGVPPPPVPISTITKGETSNGHGRPGGYATLGQPKAKMHGEKWKTPGHSLKHERLHKRLEYKKEKRIMKTRQKEAKTVLKQMLKDTVNGTFEPSAQRQSFPASSQASTSGGSPNQTHVNALRRESIAAIPNTTYLIQKSPRHVSGLAPLTKTYGTRELSVPQAACMPTSDML